MGTPVVLGPVQRLATNDPVAAVLPYQQVVKRRSRPGSGRLDVKVTNQGPVLVVTISDKGTTVCFSTL